MFCIVPKLDIFVSFWATLSDPGGFLMVCSGNHVLPGLNLGFLHGK